MGMMQEFKEFAIKGNAVDLAVGVVIGAAFGKIVTSIVEDIIMPPIGMLMGGSDFTNLFYSLDGSDFATLAEAKEAGAAVLGFGSFIQTAINFLIIAFAIFMMVKAINKATAAAVPEEIDEAPVEPSEDVLLLREIRDSIAVSVNKLADTHAAIESVASQVPAAIAGAGAAIAAASGVSTAAEVEVEEELSAEAEEVPLATADEVIESVVEPAEPIESKEEPKPDGGATDGGT